MQTSKRTVRLLALLLALALALTLAACSQDDETEGEDIQTMNPNDPVNPDQPEEPPAPPEPPKGPQNPLTGLYEAPEYVLARPVAAMINNLKTATPPRGLSQYDAAFEVLAEGEINRIIALFYDYADIPELGSIRSARDYYYFKLALPMDPIIAHYGGSDAAYIYIKQNGLDTLNGMEGNVHQLLYWRDQQRIQSAGYEHSVFTSGEKLVSAIDRLDRRTELKEGADKPFFSFAAEDDPVAGTLPAEDISVRYSSYITAAFAYDADKGCYLRSQYDAPHVDETTGEQIGVDNLFVLYVPHRNVGDEAGHIEVQTTGSGDGYYFSRGTGQALKWSKKGDGSFFVFTDETGQPLTVNPGRMWFCVVKPGAEVSYSAGAETPAE